MNDVEYIFLIIPVIFQLEFECNEISKSNEYINVSRETLDNFF